MAKRIDIEGKSYRMRRGKLVEIPAEWVGRQTTKKTIRQRLSKLAGPRKRAMKDHATGGVNGYKDRRDILAAPMNIDITGRDLSE
jgi:hypothetical protein